MYKTITVIIVALTIFFIFLTERARADFYSYVDSKGVIHLTNAPTSDKFRWMMMESASSIKQYGSYDAAINKASSRHGVESELIKAVIKAESDFDPTAVSTKGAVGLMQLMPHTASRMGVRNIYDPHENIEGGVKYLSSLLKKFKGNTSLAVAAYNAGEKAVTKYGSIPPFSETRVFVERVLDYRKTYRNAGK